MTSLKKLYDKLVKKINAFHQATDTTDLVKEKLPITQKLKKWQENTIFVVDGSCSENIVTLGVDNSSSVHVDNKNIYLNPCWRSKTQKLDDTVITEDAKYQINFARPDILLYNRSNSLHHLKCKRFQNKTISILFV